jgi:hypothetical protein
MSEVPYGIDLDMLMYANVCQSLVLTKVPKKTMLLVPVKNFSRTQRKKNFFCKLKAENLVFFGVQQHQK